MKIIYREPTLIEQMKDALKDKSKYIESFEITEDEFTRFYSSLDKNVNLKGETTYMYSGIPIKVIK